MEFKENKKYNKELKKLFKIDSDLKEDLKVSNCIKNNYLNAISYLYDIFYYDINNIDSYILFEDLTDEIDNKNKFQVEVIYNKLYKHYFNYLIVKIYKTL